ncbi:Cytosolic iron-sulfur protein assembly protein [Puttea exsequens]|nr:Cytosolic iron-sulfur protein assembly protein [Puttea exsequens]
MSPTLPPLPLNLTHLTTLSPPSPSRAWLTAPHPTAPILATCSSDKTVRIYSLPTASLLSTIAGGHKRSIRTCAWKPNLRGESVLATGSFDASVGIWRRFDGGELNPRPEGGGFGSGDEEEEEEEEEWRFALVLDGHESEIKSVAWSAGGNLLATCSRDKSVWIWEEVGEDDFETVAVLQEHGGDVKCVAWHPEEECVASASYDDEVRVWREDVDDWACCAVLRGHGGTVWGVMWEGVVPRVFGKGGEERGGWLGRREKAGPRLVTCSDDLSVRVWRRRPREKVEQSRLSIIRSGSIEEEWVEEAQLPVVHTRPIYAVAWSTSGRVVSTGGDGAIVVYEERWKQSISGSEDAELQPQAVALSNGHAGESTELTPPTNGQPAKIPSTEAEFQATEWVIVAQVDGAHDVFEINHVTWAPRRDTDASSEREDLIVSTGDDGVVKVWELDG